MQFQKISIQTLWKVIGNFEGEDSLKHQNFHPSGLGEFKPINLPWEGEYGYFLEQYIIIFQQDQRYSSEVQCNFGEFWQCTNKQKRQLQ